MQNPTREAARVEYFSGAIEPTVTVRKSTVRFSSYCLRKMPDVDYVVFAINPAEKMLVIEPCRNGERDAVRWSCLNPETRKPKIITCKEYYRRLCGLMGWNEGSRYTILGKISGGGDKTVIMFDLTAAIAYQLNLNSEDDNERRRV
jgi:hypothetical protein